MPEPLEIPPEQPQIYEIRQYADEVGQRVLMKCRLDGSHVEYVGQARGRLDLGNGQVDMWEYGVHIEATSIEEAFANFVGAMKEQWPAILAERKNMHAQMRKRIVMPQGTFKPRRHPERPN